MKKLATYALLTVLLTACGPTEQARREYVQTHDRPAHVEEAIMKEKIVVGMSKEDVRMSWGRPGSINNSYHEGLGSESQWCYGGSYGMQCLYFEGGRLTGWN